MESERSYQERLINIVEFLSEKDIKKKKLDLLQRMMERSEAFKEDCEVCSKSNETYDRIIRKIEMSDDTYRKEIKEMKLHMLKNHKLLEEGYYTAMCLSFGLFAGVLAGVLLDSYSLFLAAGISLGLIIGILLDKQAKKNNKVL